MYLTVRSFRRRVRGRVFVLAVCRRVPHVIMDEALRAIRWVFRSEIMQDQDAAGFHVAKGTSRSGRPTIRVTVCVHVYLEVHTLCAQRQHSM